MRIVHQFVLMAALVPFLWGLLYLTRPRLQRAFRWAIAVYAGVVLIPYTCLVISYVTAPGYIRYEEPFTHVLALLFARGEAVYPGVSDAARYGGPYGPMLYMLNAWVISLFGTSQHVLKAFNAFALAGALIALFTAVRKVAGPWMGLAAAALLCAFLNDARDFPLSIRGDGLLMLCVCVALLAVQYRRAVPIAALTAAVAINIKVHAVLYFLPLLAFAGAAYGVSTAATATLIAAGATAAPFLLPQVSLTAYVSWLRVTGSLRPSPQSLAPNLAVVVYLLMPAACAFTFARVPLRRGGAVRFTPGVSAAASLLTIIAAVVFAPDGLRFTAWPLVVFLASLACIPVLVLGLSCVGDALPRPYALFCQVLAPAAVLVAIVASKPGAGYWHLIPFAPLLLWLAAVTTPHGEPPLPAIAILLSLAVSAALTGYVHSGELYREIKEAGTPNGVARDIETILHEHAGLTIQMGYGGRDPDTEEALGLSYYRPMLVAKGLPYTLDPVSIETANAAGLAIPQSTMAALRRCETSIWLIPRGRPPFLLRSRYNRSNLFSGFRETFLNTHELRESSTYFDLWYCKRSLLTQ